MTSREFTEWMVYAALEPFGEERADLRNAQLMALLANLHSSKDDEPYSATDFMPDWELGDDEGDEETALANAERLLSIVEHLNAAFGGEDLRPRDVNDSQPGR